MGACFIVEAITAEITPGPVSRITEWRDPRPLPRAPQVAAWWVAPIAGLSENFSLDVRGCLPAPPALVGPACPVLW
ncbi:hypothetical protein GCM10018952_70310 [Streptosporangium vulgare]